MLKNLFKLFSIVLFFTSCSFLQKNKRSDIIFFYKTSSLKILSDSLIYKFNNNSLESITAYSRWDSSTSQIKVEKINFITYPNLLWYLFLEPNEIKTLNLNFQTNLGKYPYKFYGTLANNFDYEYQGIVDSVHLYSNGELPHLLKVFYSDGKVGNRKLIKLLDKVYEVSDYMETFEEYNHELKFEKQLGIYILKPI